MKMKQIATKKAPAAIGPYSQGYTAGGFLFTAGQAGLKPDGSKAGDSVAEQARQSFENLKAIAEEAGTDLSRTVKALCFLADMKDFQEFNQVYQEYFPSKPARSCVAVKELPAGLLCETEIIIALDD